MKFVLLLAFLFMWLAHPITGFPGFNNPEKWMKRAIRKLQRKTNAYGTMIASNTDEISNTAGFISTIDQCENNYINDPDNGLSCCFEDNLNKGQCLCNGMTIDDTSNTGTCCMANKEHPDHCLCSGTDMDDPTNPGNCCFANSGQCLCKGNYTDVPSKRCFNLDWKGDGICDDQNNHGGCNFDGGDCCGDNVDTELCTQCQCLEEEAPLPNAVGCCFKRENNSQECLCTGTQIDDPETPGSCCLDDVDNPGNCYRTCPDDCTNSSQGICDTSTGICDCKPGFAGHNCSEACTANQITYANICQDCSAGEVPDVMSNLTACVACNPEEIPNNGSCQACPEGQVPNANQTVCEVAGTTKQHCGNIHLNNLLNSTSTNTASGWTIDCNEGVWNRNVDTCENWYGWGSGGSVGSIATTLSGYGRARLDFGNCYDRGTVKAFLDGEEIESANSEGPQKVVEFIFIPGSRLSISEHDKTIIQFNSLEIIDCNIVQN